MRSTRYMKLNFEKALEWVNFKGKKLDEKLLREQIKYIPRFKGSYTAQVSSEIVPNSLYPVINSMEGVFIGKFSDVAPWDGKRHTWLLRLNGTPGASIYGDGASLYQIYVKLVEEGVKVCK